MIHEEAIRALALASSFGAVTVVWTPVGLAATGGAGAVRAESARRAEQADETAAKAAAAQKRAEERSAPAQFSWTRPFPATAQMDERADAKRDEAIEKLLRILPTLPDGDRKAELVFRLSELYWAKSKSLHLRSMRFWDEKLEAWAAGGRTGPQPKLEEQPDYGVGEVVKRKALDLYELILTKYPHYARKDEVLYNLGSSLYESGQKEKGVDVYWQLIKQYPGSGLAADAWLQLGEHYFNSNELANAVKAYTKAAETRKPRIYSYALYKLAWCDYNLQKYDRALAKLRDVVAYSKEQQAGHGVSKGDLVERDRIQLVEEALSDMARVYSHVDAVEDAFRYYTDEVGRERAYRYLRKLGGLYESEGKYALEIETYRRLNDEYPYAPEAPENAAAVMSAYALLGRSDEVRREARRLIDLYSPNGAWARENAGNGKVLEAAFEVVEQRLAALVTQTHREAQESKRVESYELARDLYAEYLDKFTSTANSYRLRFFYAEILFELKEFSKAAEQYTMVVEEDPNGELVQHAAYASILAWEKVLSGAGEKLGKKIAATRAGKGKGRLEELEPIRALEAGKSYEQEQLSAVEQKLAAACDRFVRVAPDAAEAAQVEAESARLYYVHNQFEEAAKRFGDIIARWPKSPLARTGAAAILDSFAVRRDWTRLNVWARTFRDNELLMSEPGFAKKVEGLVEGASFNEIHFVYEPKSGPLDTAARYAAFVEEFPKSKLAMVGLYNAVINYDRAGRLDESIHYAEVTLRDYADFEVDARAGRSDAKGTELSAPARIREEVLFLLAGLEERTAGLEEAAAYYEQYAREMKRGEKRADALFNAGVLRQALGELDSALTSFEAYIKQYPAQRDVPDVLWRIGLVLEEKGDDGAARSRLERFVRLAQQVPARRLCAELEIARTLGRQGRLREARRGYEEIIESYRKLPEADRVQPCPLEAAAAAAFEMVEPLYREYQALDLSGSERAITKKLVRKLEMVDDLQKRYTEVLGIGQGDYGIAALYRIGRVYEELAQAMLDTPCPRRLDEDQCMIYQSELQAKASPLQEKAVEAYDKALGKAYELGLYDDWLVKAQQALEAYEPERFPAIYRYELIADETILAPPSLVEVRR